MSQASPKEELFERTPIPKAVATLAIPTVISQLVMMFYNLADTFWVGMLNNPLQNAAVTLTAPALMAFNAITNLFGTGSASLMSRALGRKDYDVVSRTSVFGFYCAVVLAALYAIICTIFRIPLLGLLGADEATFASSNDYLIWAVIANAIPAVINVTLAHFVRAEGSAAHSSIGTMSGCVLNIILDPILILPWGLDMGAAGAGLATFIANCVACLYFAVFLIRKKGKTFVSVDPRKFVFRKDIISEVFNIGIPSALQNLFSVTGMTVLNNFTAAHGANAVAAMGICQKVYMVPMYITLGVSQGSMPIVGYNYASGNVPRVKKTITFTRIVNLAIIIFMALFYFIFPAFFVSLFINDQAIIDHGVKLLRGFAVVLPLMSLDFFSVSIFQATGMGKAALIFAVLRKIILEIPLLFLMNRIYPLYGLPYAQVITEFILATVSIFFLARLYKEMDQMTKARLS